MAGAMTAESIVFLQANAGSFLSDGRLGFQEVTFPSSSRRMFRSKVTTEIPSGGKQPRLVGRLWLPTCIAPALMRNRGLLVCLLMVCTALPAVPAYASTILFNTVPFDGSTALTTPGRQIVGGEPFLAFDPALDVLAFDTTAFPALGGTISFANGTAASLPTSGINAMVLQEFGPPMNAGLAANLIAARITLPGAGVFIYFNTGLGLARLVYSTNLDDETADLQVLARFTNLTDPAEFGTISASDFQIVTTPVPEPGSLALLVGGLLLVGRSLVRRRHVRQT